LRYLQATGRIPQDLASAIITPSTYRYEGLPSTISSEQIRSILSSARKDRSRSGIRNYAILLLLATYGLRAGEVCKLRLDDIDWRAARLWIRHTKSGAHLCLPLLPVVGTALLNYLRQARPQCQDREIFIRMHAPRSALVTKSAIHSLFREHMARIGIQLNGKRGPHVFRHARAASLLRAGVPLKTVGDLLGHRHASSTAVYLKLDDQQLRKVALSLPLPEVTP
jgi:integrase